MNTGIEEGEESMTVSTKESLRATLSMLAFCTAVAVGTPAYAQNSGDDDLQSEEEQESAPRDEDIIVTGTSIAGVKPTGAEAVVITREDAEKTGHTTPAELLRTLPQVRTGEYDREGGVSTISLQNSAGSNTVNLRGLTSTSSTTLILVDGRRTVGTGANVSAVDANQVPLAALQRVEIVADGASAIYGSDAIGGVINYILRKDYQGAEISLRGNNTQGGFERGVSITGGTSWNAGGLGRGNILLTYDYAKRDPYIAGKNPYLRYDLTSLGGPDRRVNGGIATVGFIPSIVVTPDAATNPPINPVFPRAGSSIFYGVPEGAGPGLTVGQLLVNQPALTDFSYFTDYLGKQDRHQVSLYLNQELGQSLELFVQGRYSDRKTITRSTEAVGSTGVTQVQLRSMLRDANGAVTTTPNPFYVYNVPGVSQGSPAFPGFPPFIPPIPAQPAADLTVLYPALKDFGARTYLGSDESYNVTAGLRAKLPGNWEGEVSYTLGRNEGCTYCQIGSYVNTTALQYQIDIGAINPLSSAPLSPAMLAKVSGTQKQIGHNGIDDINVKLNGPLFALPGGTVRAAIGGERNKVFNWNENTSLGGIMNLPTVLTDKNNSYYSRTITSAYGELYVPLVGDDMNVPLMKRFAVSGAVRYDDYNDTGSTTNPKFGFTWEVSDILSFGGTWGTSFRAPGITDKNPSAYVSGFVTLYPVNFANLDPRVVNDLCFGPGLCFTTAGILFGSNPDLKPERSTNWSLSAAFKPGGGFKANATYYNIRFKDRLVFPATIAQFPLGPDAGSNPPTYSGYESYITPINNPATCNNGDISTADPALQSILSTPIYTAGGGVSTLGGFSNFCSIRVLLDSRFQNQSETFTDGLDLSASWEKEVGEVFLNIGASANVILNFKERVIDDSVQLSTLGLLSARSVKWRGRGNIGAYWRGASATLFANYTGPFTNDQARNPINAVLPNERVPSYTTFDLNLGYSTDFAKRKSPLKSLRFSLTIQNLFNDTPPLVRQSEKVIADAHGIPFGRTAAFQITAGF